MPYTWNGQTITVAGTYTAHLTSVGGCDSIATLALVVNASINTSQNVSTCQTSVVLPDGSIATSSGVYKSMFKNSAGCDSIVTTTVTFVPSPDLVINNPVATCASATTDLTSASITAGSSQGLAFTYWQDSAATIPLVNPANVGSGTYYIKATSSGGCFVIKPVIVTQALQPALVITNPPTTCVGSTVDLTDKTVTAGSSAGLTYTYWADAAAQNKLANARAVSVAGTYYIKATNAAGCSLVLPVKVTITSSPSIVVTNPASACMGSKVDLTAAYITGGSDPGLDYSYWQDRLATLPIADPGAVSSPGTYYIKAKAQGSCFTIMPVEVAFNQAPTAVFNGDQSICQNANAQLTISLTGNVPWNITYTDGANTYTIKNITTPSYTLTVSPAITTTFTILSVSDAACSNATPSSATVTVTPGVPGVRYPTVSTYAFEPVQLSARNLGSEYSYNWAPPAGLDFTTIRNPMFNYGLSTQYYVTLTPPSGCVTVDTVLVTIKNPQDTGLVVGLWVPKAWTPNNDGMNDILYPITIHIRQIVYFRVFDRWGQLMYETNVLGQGWNGVYKGRPQVSDVYTWTVEAIGDDNSVIRKAGNSILLR
ncbi:MAG: hypothetical protein C5B59_14365 [Bacteroidetes bacterium]|nr:MAG: hypothetical protein C5B59_14365 [Bacteroidota bacterium]